jgi:ABC-type spermidine/putrescine transport systems, ATPase components
MSNIKVVDAVKKYGNNTVISGLNLEIKEGEFFTLLGPSGCGKTTLLRMIAGFNSIEGGDFYFDDVRINDMDPSKRNIGMVFQNYAIFPHLTVEENVKFGLKNRTKDKEAIKKETEKFLKAVQIYEYKDRLPEKLSGGQQQRVALARALVIKPDVLLMDEPLSNLDTKLRVELRQVIRDIQREVGITTVYVTHDQEEAMAISDRIAVMKSGKIQHIGKPKEIYHRPKNIFVATFIGRTNIIDGEIKTDGSKKLNIAGHVLQMESINTIPDQKVKVSIRPEDFIIEQGSVEGIKGSVLDSIYLGLNTHYIVEIENGLKIEVIKESDLSQNIEPGSKISLSIKKHKINIFSEDGETNLLRGDKDEK